MSVTLPRYPQGEDKPTPARKSGIAMLPPVLVPITEAQIEEASDILAELMLRHLRRKARRESEDGK